jgi:hypothetical protein
VFGRFDLAALAQPHLIVFVFLLYLHCFIAATTSEGVGAAQLLRSSTVLRALPEPEVIN